ncbi:hypothetical protein EHS39_23820 [Ensifer sp. MPMI2T]|nr:hypothetical protein EHS39_23820 [Ensifer sp. MPMI2T]
MTEYEVDEDIVVSGGKTVFQTVPQPKGSRRSFQSVRRDLSEEELSAPGVQKMLLDDLERLEEELATAKAFRERFHVADKRAAILEEQLATANANEFLYNGCLMAGSVLLGFAPNVWSNGLVGLYLLIAGVIITGGALFSKWLKK